MKNKRETIQKTIILEKTRRLANHPTAEEIYRAVRADFPRVSMGTVYRNLNRLAGEGKIKKSKSRTPPTASTTKPTFTII